MNDERFRKSGPSQTVPPSSPVAQPPNTGREVTLVVFGVAALALILGAIIAMAQWRLQIGQAVAITCLLGGVLLTLGATFFWLVTGTEKTATVVAQGQIVLGTGAGLVLALWGQVFITLGFISAWRLLYPPKQALPLTPGAGELPFVGNLAQLIQALTVAPTWLGMTAVGIVLTFVGAWVIRGSRSGSGQ